MQHTMMHHPRLRVVRSTGSEGPKHDPYSFEEYQITTPQGKLVLHFGLGTWARFQDQPILLDRIQDENACVKLLRGNITREATGYTLTQIERIARKLTERCRCGSKEFESASGFPGEHFTVCCKCGNVVDSFFCRSEVE